MWLILIFPKFFDRVHHDRLISRLAQHINDKRILRIIGMTLRSGVMKDGLYRSTDEGTVQGGPLSPLLSNVVLDELDKELVFNKLIKRGVSRSYAANAVYNNDGRWAISGKFAMAKAYSVPWFINQMGQQVRSDQKRVNPHWFSIGQWIRMT
jgi:retron-type reverse transcriptase